MSRTIDRKDYERAILLLDSPTRSGIRKRLLQAQRVKLIRAVDAHACEIHAWLDGFPPGKMTAAAAFLYLAEGVEEIRGARPAAP
jgi:hypothetical protein